MNKTNRQWTEMCKQKRNAPNGNRNQKNDHIEKLKEMNQNEIINPNCEMKMK